MATDRRRWSRRTHNRGQQLDTWKPQRPSQTGHRAWFLATRRQRIRVVDYRPGCDERTREHSVVLLQWLSALGRRQGPRAAVSRRGRGAFRHNPGNASVDLSGDNQKHASLYVLWITRSKMPECSPRWPPIRNRYSPGADSYATGRSVRYSVVDRKIVLRSSRTRS